MKEIETITENAYNLLKNEVTAFTYTYPPYSNKLYNLEKNKRVHLETLNLKLSFDFQRNFIKAKLINDEILVIQRFFSGENHEIYCAWLEKNSHIFIFMFDVNLIYFDNLKFKTKQTQEISNPNIEKCLTKTNKNNCLFKEDIDYLLYIIEDNTDKYTDILNDDDYDNSKKYQAYRKEFRNLEEHFDIILTNMTLPTLNLTKELNIELNALWNEALKTVNAYSIPCMLAGNSFIHLGSLVWSEAQQLREGAGLLETGGVHQCEAIDKILPILEFKSAMWMQVIGCPENVRSSKDFFSILHKILQDETYISENTFRDSLISYGFRNKFVEWIVKTIFNSEDIERDLLYILNFYENIY